MRHLYRALIIVIALAVFFIAFFFISSNREIVTVDLLLYRWHWEAQVGVLVIAALAIGLLIGLLAGVGLRSVKSLFS